MKFIEYFYNAGSMPDITNLADVILSVLLIPIILYLWEKRFRWRIPIFELNIDEFEPGTFISDASGNHHFKAIGFRFVNKADSTIFITDMQLYKTTKLVNIPKIAFHDSMTRSYELKFDDPTSIPSPQGTAGSSGGVIGQSRTVYLNKRQMILNSPDGEAFTAIAVVDIPNNLSAYKPNFWRKLFIVPKYFVVRYIVMMNGKRFKIIAAY